MPYKSEAQRKFFNSPAGKKKIGEEEVEKWNEESKGLKLPKKSLKDAIAACDKDSPIEGQLDIFGKIHHENKKKTYRVDLNEKGANYTTWLSGYSESQIRGYIKSHFPKAKINSIRED